MIRPTFTQDGKKRWIARRGYGSREQRTFDTKGAAQEWLDEGRRARRRAKAGMEVTQGPIKFDALVKLYEENFDPSPWRKGMLRLSLERWGDVYVREMRPEGIGAWLNALDQPSGEPYSEKTKRHVLETLRQVLNAGVEWGYLSKSPARPRSFKTPSGTRIRPIRPFESWEEVERVASFCKPVPAAFVRFCCATGVRVPGEAVDIDWRQISRQKREMVVHGTKTENAPRTIPLSRPALEALDSLPRALSGRVFIGKRGGRFDYQNWRDTEWRDALALAGLDHRTPYEMRHTFATLALQAGAQLEDVAKVLGHANTEITLRFYRKWTRPMADRLRGVLDTIGEETDGQADDESGIRAR